MPSQTPSSPNIETIQTGKIRLTSRLDQASTGSTLFLPKQRVFFHRETQPTGKSVCITHPGLKDQVLTRSHSRYSAGLILSSCPRPETWLAQTDHASTGSTRFLPKPCVHFHRETQLTGKSVCITHPGLKDQVLTRSHSRYSAGPSLSYCPRPTTHVFERGFAVDHNAN